MADPYAAIGARPVAQPAPRRPEPTLKERETLADIAARYAATEEARTRTQRLEATPLPEAPKNIAQKMREQNVLARAKTITDAASTAFVGLPKAEDQARIALQRGKSLVEHPGFEAAVGLPNPLKGGFGVGELFGPARDFSSELEKTQAGAFLQAYDALRNAGAITEKEGEVATRALANLRTSMSEDQFKKNLQEYMDIVARGVQRTRQMSQMQPIPYPVDLLQAEKARRAALRGGK